VGRKWFQGFALSACNQLACPPLLPAPHSERVYELSLHFHSNPYSLTSQPQDPLFVFITPIQLLAHKHINDTLRLLVYVSLMSLFLFLFRFMFLFSGDLRYKGRSLL